MQNSQGLLHAASGRRQYEPSVRSVSFLLLGTARYRFCQSSFSLLGSCKTAGSPCLPPWGKRPLPSRLSPCHLPLWGKQCPPQRGGWLSEAKPGEVSLEGAPNGEGCVSASRNSQIQIWQWKARCFHSGLFAKGNKKRREVEKRIYGSKDCGSRLPLPFWLYPTVRFW